MVAPNYAAARSQLAKKMGLGRKRKIALSVSPRIACKRRRRRAPLFVWDVRRDRPSRGRAACRRLPSAASRLALDALDHGAQPVGALRRQMLVEAELAHRRLGVGAQDLAGALAREQRQHDRHQPAHDMRVGIALELQDGIVAAGEPVVSARPG